MPSPITPTYVLVDLFAGRVAAIDCSRSAAIITINSWVELLQRPMPRNVYSSACRWTLFDQGCTLNRAGVNPVTAQPYAANVTVAAVTSNALFTVNGLTTTSGYYALGMITFLTGANAPFSRSIIVDSGFPTYQMQVRVPFPYQILPGDTATLYPGCDKTQTTCINKFNNKINFGGFPYIPNPESAT